MLLNIEHRRIYGGRTVLLPELQDKGVMKKVGMDSIVQVMKDTRDKIQEEHGDWKCRKQLQKLANKGQAEKITSAKSPGKGELGVDGLWGNVKILQNAGIKPIMIQAGIAYSAGETIKSDYKKSSYEKSNNEKSCYRRLK